MSTAIDESTKSISNIKGITDNRDRQAEQLQRIVEKFKNLKLSLNLNRRREYQGGKTYG